MQLSGALVDSAFGPSTFCIGYSSLSGPSSVGEQHNNSSTPLRYPLEVLNGPSAVVKVDKDKALIASLEEAARLDFLHIAATDNAMKLVTEVARCIVAGEKRRNRRRNTSLNKLDVSVAAFIGGVLEAKLRHDAMVRRSMSPNSFPSGWVSFSSARTIRDSLQSLGLIRVYPGFQSIDGEHARVARFAATDELLKLAAHFNISVETVGNDFRRRYPSTRPKARKAVTIRTMARRVRAGARKPQGLIVPPTPEEADAFTALSSDVDFGNAVLCRHSFWSPAGCPQPLLYRPFRGCLLLGGRWTVPGNSYQNMPKKDRGRILIDGVPLVEVDVCASHLTLASSILGVRLADDPYAGLGLDREIAKAIVQVALGNGRMPKSCPERLKDSELGAPGEWDRAATLVCDRYPFLKEAAKELSGPLGLDALACHGKPTDILPHRLQALEAEALTLALKQLWQHDIPALPLHDAILVPQGHEAETMQTMTRAFEDLWGVTVSLKLKA